MKHMYWLVALIYAIGAIVAFLISLNPGETGGFYWDMFGRFELTIPTIVAVLVLLLGGSRARPRLPGVRQLSPHPENPGDPSPPHQREAPIDEVTSVKLV